MEKKKSNKILIIIIIVCSIPVLLLMLELAGLAIKLFAPTSELAQLIDNFLTSIIRLLVG